MNALATEALAWREPEVAVDLERAADAFRETLDPRLAFIDGPRGQALDGLRRLADDGSWGCGLLTGGAGLGKTLLRATLQQQLAPERCAVVTVETGLLAFDDLLLEMLSQLRGERLTAGQLPGRYERLAEFKAALVSEVVATGRHLVVLLDDADQLDPGTLEAVGSLMNLASDRQTFVVPVLFGQPSLRQKLARLPALRQRIGAQFALATLDPPGCDGYVAHRLAQAGHDVGRALEAGLLARLHQASGGVPRIVNALCRHALQHAAAHGLPGAGAPSLEAARTRLMDAGGASPVFIGH
jgi:type II secretory pathway predicted ATPase ExeA